MPVVPQPPMIKRPQRNPLDKCCLDMRDLLPQDDALHCMALLKKSTETSRAADGVYKNRLLTLDNCVTIFPASLPISTSRLRFCKVPFPAIR